MGTLHSPIVGNSQTLWATVHGRLTDPPRRSRPCVARTWSAVFIFVLVSALVDTAVRCTDPTPRFQRSVRRGDRAADRQQLRSDRQQHAGTRDDRIPRQLGAGHGRRSDERAGTGTRRGGVIVPGQIERAVSEWPTIRAGAPDLALPRLVVTVRANGITRARFGFCHNVNSRNLRMRG